MGAQKIVFELLQTKEFRSDAEPIFGTGSGIVESQRIKRRGPSSM
jgi:hypothetical protein